jgi:hypothetical protein
MADRVPRLLARFRELQRRQREARERAAAVDPGYDGPAFAPGLGPIFSTGP